MNPKISGDNVPRGTSASGTMKAELLRLVPDLTPPLLDRLGRHFELMTKWNKTHNLTRVTDPKKSALLHYADSLLPLLALSPPKSVADIGSGNGLPGVVAASLWTSCHVDLIESVAKKCSFLKAVRASLSDLDLRVHNERCERLDLLDANLVLTRATFQWPDVAKMCARHLAPGGYLLAYIGSEAPSSVQWQHCCEEAGLVATSGERLLLENAPILESNSGQSVISYQLADGVAQRNLALAQKPLS